MVAGDYFIYSQNRLVTLPAAATLADCLTSSAALPNLQDYLGCEISFGLCQSGQVPWQIQRSTIPWRESTALWSPSDLAIDLEHGRVLQTVHQGDAAKIQAWRIGEWGTGKAFRG